MAQPERARAIRSRLLLAFTALAVVATSAVTVAVPADVASASTTASFTTQGPKVGGALKVGATLTTTFPTWKPAPTATGYRWSRDGVLIPGATHNTYTLTATDYGHRIWATIIGARDGYAKASRTSDLGVVGIGDAPHAVSNPVLHGAASIGSTLTVTTGGWSISGLSIRYQWLRNGGVVSGQTGSSYAVTKSDVGATLAARVVVSKSGYADASARSQVTGKIAAPAAAAPPVASPPPSSSVGVITPGALCADSQVGVIGHSSTGKAYRCGGHGLGADGRYHWNTIP